MELKPRLFCNCSMISTLLSIIVALLSPSFTDIPGKPAYALYDSLKGEIKPERELFVRGVNGYRRLAGDGRLARKEIITVIDYRLPSTEKRLWVIDLSNKQILFHTLVAHGKNSGENLAYRFSNKNESLQSSLGFFITGSEYQGKHGRSLKLIGLEKGINDAAERRAIVIHGADYVSEHYARRYGRLGRSFGCPAVPMGLHQELIDTIGEGSCVFIYYPDINYLKDSLFGSSIKSI